MTKNKKKERRIVGVGVIAAIGLLAFAILLAFAASGSGGEAAIERNVEGSEGLAVTASTVTTGISYQGMLTDSGGNPLSGTYTMTFKLYNVSSGGTALDTDTHSVEVENGLFNTNIDFAQSYFDGRALWLGITVGTDSEMTSRQELRPVPYALSLRPGAVINGSLSGPVLKVNTDGDDSYGVYAYTTGYDSEGFYAETTGEDSEGFYAETYGDYSEGVNARTYGDYSEGVYARTSGYDSPAVYGWSEQDVGVYGKGKEGGYFEASDSSGKGVYGEATNTGDVRNYGGFFVADGIRGRGVYGKASNTGDAINYGGFFYASGTEGRGVFGQAAGSEGIGVKGWAENTGDVRNYGGYFVANGSKGTGVYGKGKEGGFFTTTTAGSYGNRPAGVNVSTAYDYNTGVRIKTTGDYSGGVFARSYSNDSYGVYAITDGDRSDAVTVLTLGDNSDGFNALAGGYDSNGIYANSVRHYGVYARGYKAGIYAKGYGSKYAAEFQGKVLITGYDTGNPVMELGEGLDYAEGFDVSDKNEIAPGTVLIIDPDNPGKLTMSDTAYDTKVAGIVAGAKGQGSGVRLGADQFDYDVALAGRVYCNVDATEAGLEPGDLLTTSATPGYAMKATDYERAQGAILGKAMERLENGEKGQILVIVTLQ